MPQIKVNAANFVKVEEITDTRVGTPFTVDNIRTYERRWLVVVNNKEMGASMVCRAPGLPAPWSPYMSADGTEFDELAVMVNLSARKFLADEFYHWIVTAQYSTEVPEGGIPALTMLGADAKGSQNEPWLERPIVEWDWDESTDTPSRDLDGKPYTNSANMPFTPAPAFPAARSVLVIRRNERGWSRELATQYAYAVNADTVAGAEPGTVRCIPPRAKPMNRGRLQFYEVTYRLVFNLPKMNDRKESGVESREAAEKGKLELQTWQPEILDQGTHQLQTILGVPYASQPVPIFRYGHPVTRDVLLDGVGREAVKNEKTGRVDPHFLKFRQFHKQKFRPILETGIFGGI